jgi:nucleoside-diphosphate-sugar epimerase
MTDFSGKRVLVTGAGGHIGSHLTRALHQRGAQVIAAVRPDGDLWRIADIADEIELLPFDFTWGADRMDEALKGKESPYVFHLAAAGVNPSDPSNVRKINMDGTSHLVQVVREWQNVERFIYTGSCFEYGGGSLLHEAMIPQPQSEYGYSKWQGWIWARNAYLYQGLPTTGLRPFTVYGAAEAPHRLVPTSIINALRGSPMPLTEGRQTRDFVHVEDMVEAYLTVATNPAAVGEIFNVCTGVETSIRDLVQTVIELTGSRSEPQFGAIPYRDNEMWSLSGDPSKARDILGFTAKTSLRDGLAKTIEWFRQNLVRY